MAIPMPGPRAHRAWRRTLAVLAVVAATGVPTLARAQFAMVPTPLPGQPKPSEADDERAYRRDGARHVYATYPTRIYKGRMPPLLHGVAIVDVEIDASGAVLDVRFKRPPVNAEVAPWIVQMIRRAAPFPAPERLGKAVYTDIWLVHKGGNFQLDTLTEGQD